MKIKKYEEISDLYKDSLFLGNGASIAISQDSFSYSSLLKHGIKHGFVSEPLKEVFAFFHSTDFEFVLRHLWFASKINKSLSINEQKTLTSYEEIKRALIRTVLSVHPKPSAVSEKIDAISSFIQNFSKIFYLNYDLLLYWALIKANNQNKGNRIKDCFYKGRFSEDWTYYEEPRIPVSKSTLVFYPHGNLCLLKTYNDDLVISERKIELPKRLPYENLLDEIVLRWDEQNSVPLFISEGTWKHKLNSIDSSGYLSDVYYSAIPSSGTGVTFYGWAINEQDEHILKALKRAKVTNVAVSVHFPTTPDVDLYCRQVQFTLKKKVSKGLQIEFFDAESEGCWVY